MIRKGKLLVYICLFIILTAAISLFGTKGKQSNEVTSEIRPTMGSIQAIITSTAIVQPQNRLEIKPPINGRIEQILVQEGEEVKTGQVLAWMSSTERAALLDAARSRGSDEMKYWEDVYKPTPIISPIDGEVIVSKDYPGQTITSSDDIVVLSDHLIVQAQVDETDIGKIRLGQEATITLDAYPQIKIAGKINHIYYESLIVNNVTIYQVDILPDKIPDVFRSGMSATVSIVEMAKDNVLTLPLAAVKRSREGSYVLLYRGKGQKPEEHKIETGISDEKNVEIISGLTTDDRVLMTVQKYKAGTTGKAATNPLSPFGQRRSR